MLGKIELLGKRDSKTRGSKNELIAEVGGKDKLIVFSGGREWYQLENGILLGVSIDDTSLHRTRPKRYVFLFRRTQSV